MFPISEELKDILSGELKSHFALRLACQDSFEKWMDQDPKQHEAHAKSFGRRALHEKVAYELGANLQKQNRHGIRNSHNKDKTEYLNDASTIFSVKGNCDRTKVDQKLSEEWTEDFEWLGII